MFEDEHIRWRVDEVYFDEDGKGLASAPCATADTATVAAGS